MANLAALCVAFLILVVGKVQGRFLRLNSSELLVSDGVDHVDYQPPFLSLNGMFSSSETCEHYYGFLPCADNIGGYLFQIVVYNYLLASGEKFLTMGSKQLFNIIGTGFFGDVFEILMVLPEIMVSLIGIPVHKSSVLDAFQAVQSCPHRAAWSLLETGGREFGERVSRAHLNISGLTEDDAQSRVSVAVGMYAGSTVFCLTLQWGMCVIFGRKGFTTEKSNSQDSEPPSTSKPSLIKEKLFFLTDSGITTDKKTSYTAGIMLLSLIPFIIVQLSNIVNTSSGSRLVLLIALIVSVVGLISYFIFLIHGFKKEV
ncbi:hypothetical protein CsSME_00031861 [Camellia sinensis var. sinensis]